VAALLMHGTEGEVYANPQRCPQISLIDEQGVRVLYERQTEMAAEAVVLPASKDPRSPRAGLSAASPASNRCPTR
jgi:anthranilate phosphoribosyltransferase